MTFHWAAQDNEEEMDVEDLRLYRYDCASGFDQTMPASSFTVRHR